jgi:hypothetical protein
MSEVANAMSTISEVEKPETQPDVQPEIVIEKSVEKLSLTPSTDPPNPSTEIKDFIKFSEADAE